MSCTKSFVFAPLITAVALFLWGFIFWTVLPISKSVMHKKVANENLVTDIIQHNVSGTGYYYLPLFDENDPEDPRFLSRHKSGPLIQITYREEGALVMSGKTFGLGFLHYWFTSLMLAFLLCFVKTALPDYSHRWKFIIMVGFTASVFIDLSGPIWFHTPLALPLLNFVYHISSAIIAGSILAIQFNKKTVQQ